jgi:hypothetical protein
MNLKYEIIIYWSPDDQAFIAAAIEVAFEKIVHVDRLPGLHAEDPVQRPAGQKKLVMLRARKFVNEVPGEALPRIEIRAGSFIASVKAVIRLAGVGDKVLSITRRVERMRPCIVHVRGQTMGPEADGCLEPVIVGVRSRFELVDVDEIGVGDGTAPNTLIHVAIAEQFAPG